jgi:hypothetical protein
MNARYLVIVAAFVLALLVIVSPATADTLKLKDGTSIEGVIKKVEAGKVFVAIKDETKVLSILDVDSMDFNTPHLLADTPNLPAEHFMKSTEAQEIVRNMQELDKAAADIKKLLSQIETYWVAKQPIDPKEEPAWFTAKDTFRKPLLSYQEILNDLYFHVLARVDEYNGLMKQASKLYVGVKGVRVGSALVPADMQRLPLRKYVPAAWFDTIFYDGYNLGYSDATQKISIPR